MSVNYYVASDIYQETGLMLTYEASWGTHEEWGGFRVFEDSNGNSYVSRTWYSVTAETNQEEWSDPVKVSDEELIELIDMWTNTC